MCGCSLNEIPKYEKSSCIMIKSLELVNAGSAGLYDAMLMLFEMFPMNFNLFSFVSPIPKKFVSKSEIQDILWRPTSAKENFSFLTSSVCPFRLNL